jgi:hypothetical protein
VRLEALCDVLRNDGAEARANQVRAFTPEDVLEHEGALLAVFIVDSSLQVRGAAETLLARRSSERQAEVPAPKGPLSEADRAAIVRAHATDPSFLAVALAYERGRELLGLVDLDQVALDDALLGLALRSGPETIDAMLRLPFDVAGRGVYLIDRLADLTQDGREAVMRTLAWVPLQERAVTDGQEVSRAGVALWVWVEGLLADPDSAPTFAEFMEAGGSLQSGVVTETAQPLQPETMDALVELARTVYLAQGPEANQAQLDRESYEADLSASLAELRVVAWRLLLENRLAAPSEVLKVLEAEPAGAQVELLAALPAEVPPALAQDVIALLDHKRASVRLAAVQVLARNPVLAAMACADIDARSADAPLDLLAAQPAALVAPSLALYLEADRDAASLVRALTLLDQVPDPTWERWLALLGHDDISVRRAASAAALRAQPVEGWEAHLPAVLEASPGAAMRWIRHFGMPRRHGDVAGVLLSEEVGDRTALEAVGVLRHYGDAAAWAVLAAFLRGRLAPRRRFGTRRSREAALEALLDLAEPVRREAWSEAALPEALREAAWAARSPRQGLLEALLGDRDPFQVSLGVRYLTRRGVRDDWALPVYDLTQECLRRLERGTFSRAFRAAWARFWRMIFRAWVSPGGRVRGGASAAALLSVLLDLALRRGAGGVWIDDLRPLVASGAPAAVRPAAVRLYVALHSAASFPELLRGDSDVALEAIRSGQPDRVEVEVGERLDRLSRGDWSLRDSLATWIEARPCLAYLPRLVSFLPEARLREFAARGLRALAAVPGGRERVLEALRDECSHVVAARDDSRLRNALELLEALAAWELLPLVLPALAWAKETGRQRLVELLRGAGDHGVALDERLVADLFAHPLGEVRVMALSLLRKTAADPWPLVRAFGPGREPRPTDFAKPFLGVCEDHYRQAMGLTLEAHLGHPSGEVARRALKLISQREQEVACLALFQHLDDPELRTPILTALSTWSRRGLDPEGRLTAEQLEEERRKLRALIAQLVEGPRSQALECLEEASSHTVVFARAAGLFACGRLALGEQRARVAAGLGADDPVVARVAAWAAGQLEAGEELDAGLQGLASHRLAELRATARCALLSRSDGERPHELEGLLTDPDPEVRLATLAVARTRPEALAKLRLEARLGDPDPRVREAVLAALAELQPGEAHTLSAALRDPVPEVRLAAIQVVAAWGDETLESVRHLVGECVADPSIHVSGAALDLLGAPEGGGAFAAAKDPVEAEAETEGETETEAEAETEGETETEAEAEAETEGQTEGETEAEAETEGETETEAEGEAEGETEAGTPTGTPALASGAAASDTAPSPDDSPAAAEGKREGGTLGGEAPQEPR